jgi:hypothetical protein
MIRGFVGASFYPIADIKEMRHAWKDARGGEHPAFIEFKDGRDIRVNDADINRIVRQSTPIVPATPGFELLYFGYMPGIEDPGPWVHREPIIGWRDGQYGGLDPVVVDYDFTELENQHAILQPDGRIQRGERWYDSEQAWVDDMKAMEDAAHHRKQQDQGGGDGPAT